MIYYVPFMVAALFASSDLYNLNALVRFVITWAFLFVLLGFSVFSGVLGAEAGQDYLNYFDWFERVLKDRELVLQEMKDPGFLYFLLFSDRISGSITFFFIVVALSSLALKLGFAKMALRGEYAYVIFLVIFSRFFIPHEFNQIRSGLAIPLASIALLTAYDGKRILAALLFGAAVTVHLSVLVALPFLALSVVGFRHWNRLLLVVLLCLGWACMELVRHIVPLFESLARITPYVSGDYATEPIRLLSVYFVLRFALVLVITVFFYQYLNARDRFIVVLSAAGIFVQVVFSWSDAFALRFAEVFGLFDAATFVMLMRYLKSTDLKVLCFLVITLISSVFFMSSLGLLKGYHIV